MTTDICPICRSDIGHKINCPNGVAFTSKRIADLHLTANVADSILALAAEEVSFEVLDSNGLSCLLCGGEDWDREGVQHKKNCPRKVARYRDAQGKPLLRRLCPASLSNLADKCYDGRVVVTKRTGASDYEQYEDSCLSCQGRGWVPVSGPAAVVALLGQRQYRLGVAWNGSYYEGTCSGGDGFVFDEPIYEEADTPLEALVAALTAAGEARVP